VLSRVLGTIREHGLLAKGDRVLVAVSGGPDSTALLHVLLKLAPRLGITLAVASVDHGLREESAREAGLVAERCRVAGLDCEVVVVDVGKARRQHVSVQEAARNARLSALQQAAARLGCAKVALGHTADDQAETVLFRILRGTGIAGLAGIPYQRGRFVRPLLDVRREEVLAFLAKRNLLFVTDPSNADRHYARSRIRHDVLPLVAGENPRVVDALLGLSRQARQKTASAWRDVLPRNLYLPRRVIEVVDRLVREGEGTRRVAAPGGSVVVRYGAVTWRPKEAATEAPGEAPSTGQVTIAGPGTYAIAGGHGVEVTVPTKAAWPGGNVACFDASKVHWPLVLRALRPGDRMVPRAGRGSRKLSDLIIDAKIPREDRACLPVLCDAEQRILFVPGLRPSEVGRPVATTDEWFEARLAR
jgi:tRNA(Ile)-lysidine synthase